MPKSTQDYRNSELPDETRARLLLAEMTIDEKAQQLTAVMPRMFFSDGELDRGRATSILEHGIGQVSALMSLGVVSAIEVVNVVNEVQGFLLSHTRLGIPTVMHTEALNGVLFPGHMVFPTAIGFAASWSPELIGEMADLSREQMMQLGVRQALSPVMDIALDPRWGRVHETYGEDPYLVAAMSVAFTRGMQGESLRDGVVATGKHFLGYALGQGGLNLAAFECGKRQLRDVVAYPFEAAIQLAGLRSVMNSYCEVNGVPVATSKEILSSLLRDTLGFDGYVVSDYMTLQQVVERQHSARNPEDAGIQSLKAGLDVELPMAYGYGSVLADAVRRGAIDIALLDQSVLRVLLTKFELGLFENPFARGKIDVDRTAISGTQLSRELARRSVTLLKNEGVLPLASSTQTIAVIGPHGNCASLAFPAYTFPAMREMLRAMSEGGMANMEGLEAIELGDLEVKEGLDDIFKTSAGGVPPAGDRLNMEQYVGHSYGATTLAKEIGSFGPRVLIEAGTGVTAALEPGALERAIETAQRADTVVLALGGRSSWFNGERTEGEGSDTADIMLPAVQVEFAEAVLALGKRTIVVLEQGRPFGLPETIVNAPAIVVGYFSGPFTAEALARVLFGRDNPSGKLPYTMARHSGQIPIYHHQKAGSGYRRNGSYLDMPSSPVFPFGHGLSYTSFELVDLSFDPVISTSGQVSISATLKNTGEDAGAQTVQLYVRVNTSGATRPAQQLAGFGRIGLDVGEESRLTFLLRASQLGYTNAAEDFVVEPAQVDFFLGFSSDDRRLSASFEMNGEPKPLVSQERSFFSELSVSLPYVTRRGRRSGHPAPADLRDIS